MVTGRWPDEIQEETSHCSHVMSTLQTQSRGKAWSKVHFLAWLDVGAVHECISRTSFLCTVLFTSYFINAATTLLSLTFKKASFWPAVLSAIWLSDISESLYFKLHYITYSDNAHATVQLVSEGAMHTTSADIMYCCCDSFYVLCLE